jgi:hypothetical protein
VRTLPALLFVLLLALLPATAARADDFGPWDLPAAPAVQSSPDLQPRAVSVPRGESIPAIRTTGFYLSFRFYQQVLSEIDGPRCSHRPTCSMYAIQAMKKHPLVGPFMALDRLWRAGDSSAIRPLSLLRTPEGYLYYSDPLEESDFWFR